MRPRKPAPLPVGDVPPELRVCVIEVWCDADDPHVARLRANRADDRADWWLSRGVVAWQRWRKARARWEAEHAPIPAPDSAPISVDYLAERNPDLLDRIEQVLPRQATPDRRR